MKKIAFPLAVALVISILTPAPAQAGSSSIVSISWNKKTVNTGTLDPDRSDAKATLRIKAKDSDGVCGIVAAASNPKAKGGPTYTVRELENVSGSSENGTWSATFNDFNSRNTGTWIVSYVTVIDCYSRTLKQKNLKTGLGGSSAKLNVTLGSKSLAKVTVKQTNTSSMNCETADGKCVQTPYALAIDVKDGKKKALAGAKVRLRVCNDYEELESWSCSYISLGKTNKKGKLNVSFYPSQFFDSGTAPDWADGSLEDDSFFEAEVLVLPTKKTAFSYSKKIFYLDNEYCSDAYYADYGLTQPSTCSDEYSYYDDEDYEDDED
jgi:hypothetical protein